MSLDNHQLEVMLTRMEGKLDTAIEKVAELHDWRKDYEKGDKADKKFLHERISKIRNSYGAIAAISAGVTIAVTKAAAFFKAGGG